jgi:hypothetical protein
MVMEVSGVERHADRAELLVTGSITDGVLVTGMTARLDSRPEAFTAEVTEIERWPIDETGRDTRLTFLSESPDQLEAWLTLDWSGALLILGV